MSDLLTEFPPEYVAKFYDDLVGTIPEEKAQAELRQVRTARIINSIGSVKMDGLGQQIGSIDARVYFRWLQQYGAEGDWIKDLLADNPEYCCPGYKPGRKGDLRHSKTFVGGKPA